MAYKIKNKQKDEIAKSIERAVKYKQPRKKFMSIEQREVYNKEIKRLSKKGIL